MSTKGAGLFRLVATLGHTESAAQAVGSETTINWI